MLAVTPIYAGLLAFLYLFLTASVIRQRRRQGISLGDGGDAGFLRKLRAHGNFAEYVPLALLLMALAELAGAGAATLHAVGALLLAGRLVHGWCFLFTARNLAARVAGMAMTLAAIAIGGGASLWTGMFA
jgi:uncharacterized membrane protein YecN with MAPEG domain